VADYEMSRNIVMRQKQSAANEANHIVTTGVDLVLGTLRAELTQLLDDVKALVDQLDGATTPAQAIEADAGPAWRQLTVLADAYRDLRAAQGRLMMRAAQQVWRNCSPHLLGEDTANLAVIKNLDDIWPDWRWGGTQT
jgi:hypothetical protein